MRSKFFIPFALISASILLPGCSSFGLSSPNPQTGESTAKALIPKAKTPAIAFFASKCPISKREGSQEAFFLGPVIGAAGLAVANAVIPPLIETALGLTADYFEGRARALNASTTTSANGYLFARSSDDTGRKKTIGSVQSPFEPGFHCLVFIRGRLQNAGTTPDTTSKWQVANYDAVNGQLENVQSLKSFQLATPPEVYAEFEVVTGKSTIYQAKAAASDDSTSPSLYHSIGLRPVYLDYGAIGAERKGDGEKNVLFDISFDSRSLRLGKADSPTVLHTLLDLGMTKEGEVYLPIDFAAKSAPQMFRMPQPGVYPLTSEKGAPYTDDLIPVSATVIMTETDQGGDYERAIAEAIRKNKGEIAKQTATPLIAEIKEVLDRAFPTARPTK